MSVAGDEMCWPMSRLGEVLQAMAARLGLDVRTGHLAPPPAQADNQGIGFWMETAGTMLGLDAEACVFGYAALEAQLPGLAPGVVRVPGKGEPIFLAVLGGRQGRVRVLTPELRARWVGASELAGFIRREKEAPLAGQAARILDAAQIPRRRRARVASALVTEQLAAEKFEGCWLLRLDAAAGFRRQLVEARLHRRVLLLAAAHAAEYGLWILSWWMVGVAAMEGRLDRGWLYGWALLLLTIVPIRVWGTWLQGRLAIAGGAVLKRRLLLGALRLSSDEVRLDGAGQMLGRVLESEAVESLALSGGFLAVVAAIELIFGFAVLAAGVAPLAQTATLAVWTAVTGLLAWRYFTRNQVWTRTRLRMTNDLVERMIGHRTRLAQEDSRNWHDEEDEELARYNAASRDLDRAAALFTAIVPRGWLLLGLAGLVLPFVAGTASPVGLAVSLGGVLIGYRAFHRLTLGLWQLIGAFLAWRQVAPLFHAAGRSETHGNPEFSVRPAEAPAQLPVIQAHDLVFRYGTRGDPVLRGCSLSIRPGDRVLLEGDSGCGKSTLAALLSGLRRPESGLLLAGGLDRHTLGTDGWRRRIASAPQFHENHILSGTFAFNLLMGRRWPPTEEDIAQAESLCRDLGLSVLERMPAGLSQLVGECGWQLSHGEQSRLFIARALLQDADLVILDESFGTLDPETLRQALACVLSRARALLVIAHN